LWQVIASQNVTRNVRDEIAKCFREIAKVGSTTRAPAVHAYVLFLHEAWPCVSTSRARICAVPARGMAPRERQQCTHLCCSCTRHGSPACSCGYGQHSIKCVVCCLHPGISRAAAGTLCKPSQRAVLVQPPFYSIGMALRQAFTMPCRSARAFVLAHACFTAAARSRFPASVLARSGSLHSYCMVLMSDCCPHCVAFLAQRCHACAGSACADVTGENRSRSPSPKPLTWVCRRMLGARLPGCRHAGLLPCHLLLYKPRSELEAFGACVQRAHSR